jgi:hypothetical protein
LKFKWINPKTWNSKSQGSISVFYFLFVTLCFYFYYLVFDFYYLVLTLLF